MALDISARLSDGRSALAHTEIYVSACRALGYHHPEITSYAGQLGDWFTSEESLDLDALETDCSKLVVAARAAEEALGIERKALEMLTHAWRGEAGESAADHIRCHCAAGQAVLIGLSTATDSLRILIEKLWRAVDDKVNATVTIDNRTASQRGQWLAAAATVIGGGPDRATSIDIVEREIRPYVDRDVRVDWVAAMQSTTADASAAYIEALGRLTDCKAIYFEVARLAPVPGLAPSSRRGGVLEHAVRSGRSMMSAESEERVATPPNSATGSSPAVLQPPQSVDPFSAGLPAGPPAGLPAGQPIGGIGTGLAGLVGQISDTVASLIEPSAGSSNVDPLGDEDDRAERPGNNDSEPEDEPRPEDSTDLEDAAEEQTAKHISEPEPEASGDQVLPRPSVTQPAIAELAIGDSSPASVPQTTPGSQTTDGDISAAQERTPCEMALNELPQVGQ